MCHDGAHVPVRSGRDDSEMEFNVTHKQTLAFRKMIRRFIFSGFNVALINGLEVRDTKGTPPLQILPIRRMFDDF